MQTEEEKHIKLKQFEEELTQLCPDLYFDNQHLAYCPKYGWMDVVKSMSLKLQMLNVELKRYGVHVIIQQCKDKFGMLRVYADACVMMPAYAKLLIAISDYACRWFNEHLDYNMKTVVDMPSYNKLLEEEIDEAEFDRCSKYPASNVKYVKRDEKFFRQGSYQTFRVTHQEATQHKLAYALSSAFSSFSQSISRWHQGRNYTAKQEFALQYGDMMCSKIIEEVEEASAMICESCGGKLSDSGFNRHCVTRGWVRNLCPTCAERSGVEFFVDGELHKGQKCILSKEDTQKKFGEHPQ